MKLFQNPYVVGALALVAALAVFRNTIQPQMKRSGGSRASVPQVAPSSSSSSAAASAEKELQPPAVPERTNAGEAVSKPQAGIDLARVGWGYNGAPPRDPFQLSGSMAPPARLAPPASEVLTLKAIWRQTGRNLAVINGRILGEGDPIEGYRIESIEDNIVWVQGEAGRESLEFKHANPARTNASPTTAPRVALGGTARR